MYRIRVASVYVAAANSLIQYPMFGPMLQIYTSKSRTCDTFRVNTKSEGS